VRSDGDGAGMVLFDEFCTWCAKRHVANKLAPQETRTTPKSWSEHKRRTGSKTTRARKPGAKSPPRGQARSSSSSSSRQNGRRTSGSGSPRSQRRSPGRGQSGSSSSPSSPARDGRSRGNANAGATSPRSNGRSHGIGPRSSPRSSQSMEPPSPSSANGNSGARKPGQGRLNEVAKASAERLSVSSPRRMHPGSGVVRRARTPPRGVAGHEAAALSLSRSARGEIFVTLPTGSPWEEPGAGGGFDAKITKADRQGIPVRTQQLLAPQQMPAFSRSTLHQLRSTAKPLERG
jgi:hypothetical protein